MARDVLTGQHLRTKIKGKRQNEESQRLVSSNPFVWTVRETSLWEKMKIIQPQISIYFNYFSKSALLWRRANARNVSFIKPLRWLILHFLLPWYIYFIVTLILTISVSFLESKRVKNDTFFQDFELSVPLQSVPSCTYYKGPVPATRSLV